MEILVKPIEKTSRSWIGELSIDGKFICYTIEDPPLGTSLRPKKIAGVTGIMRGRYEIALTWSNRFKMFMPLLLSVSQFDGIRIHWGIKPEHTEGCICVALTNSFTPDLIANSKTAFEIILKLIKAKIKKEKVFISLLE